MDGINIAGGALTSAVFALSCAVLVNGRMENRPGRDSLDLGVPCAADQVVDKAGFSVGFSRAAGQPLWVSYRLTACEVTNRVVGRSGVFHDEPALVPFRPLLADYKGSGYDRGHLAPAADMMYSVSAMNDSFSMANMSPQVPELNRGKWCEIESLVREFAVREGSVFVVTGPVFCRTSVTNRIGYGGVRVPDGFYKVVYDETPPQKMIGFLVPNAACTNHVSVYAKPVSYVEKVTGMRFFPSLPKEFDELKDDLPASRWKVHAVSFRYGK